MLHSILVALDGSRFAEAALPMAHLLARAGGGTIRLALAHHPLPAWNPAISFPDGGAAIEQQTRDREAQYLEALVHRLGTASGMPLAHSLLQGSPGEAIVRHAEAIGAGMVVMATHGRGPASRFWLGSTTDYVLRHVSVPVLAVHPGPDGSATDAPPVIRRIMVPIDDSVLSRHVVQPAAELAEALGAELLLLSVVEPIIGVMDPALPFPATVDPEAEAARQVQAEEQLEEIARGLRVRALGVRTMTVSALGVGATILELQEREGVDLIAMSTHGKGGLRRALIGSVTDKVIRGSHRPVLAWRPPAG